MSAHVPCAITPPSTFTNSPVMKDALSEHKNTTTFAMSLGVPIRPIGETAPAAAIALLTIGVNFVVDWFLHKASGLKD